MLRSRRATVSLSVLASLAAIVATAVVLGGHPSAASAGDDAVMKTEPGVVASNLAVAPAADAVSPWPDVSVYHTEPFKSFGSSMEMDQVKGAIEVALDAENQAMLAKNYERAATFQDSLQSMYVNDFGYLDIHKSYVDINRMSNQQGGYAETVRETTRLDFKQIQVSGDKARVIVEQENLVVREPVAVPRADQQLRHVLTVRSGRQLDLLLERVNGRWMIYADRFEFLPGMEPGSNVTES
jgi:hypothetical protein